MKRKLEPFQPVTLPRVTETIGRDKVATQEFQLKQAWASIRLDERSDPSSSNPVAIAHRNARQPMAQIVGQGFEARVLDVGELEVEGSKALVPEGSEEGLELCVGNPEAKHEAKFLEVHKGWVLL